MENGELSDRKWYEKQIADHERTLEKYDKDYQNLNPIYRAKRALQIIDLGYEIEDEFSQGFRVYTDKFDVLIAAQENRYRYMGDSYSWYWFTDLPSLFQKLNGEYNV